MMSRTLREIDEDILNCGIDVETGEAREDIDLAQLEALEMERDEKINGVGLWFKELKDDEKTLMEIIKEYQQKLKSCRTKQDGLKCWLVNATGGKKFKTLDVSISYRTVEAVVVDEEHLTDLPTDFIDIKYSANKTAIKNAIKAGTDFGELAYVEKRTSCVIK